MKKRLFFMLMSSVMLLTGCSSLKPISEEIKMELGQSLSDDPSQFVNIGKNVDIKNVKMDFSEIDFEKVGEYNVYVVNGKEKIPIKIKIEDTKKPEAEFNEQYIVCKLNEEIFAKELIKEIKDKSEVTVGFIYNEKIKELKDVSSEEIKLSEIIEENENEKYNNFELKDSISFDEEGVYETIVAVRDLSKNTSLFKINIYVDGTGPVISGFEDQNIKYDKIPTGALYDTTKIKAIDNLDGDITESDQTSLKEEIIENNKNGTHIKVYLYAEDKAGNKTEETFDVNVTIKVDEIANNVINNPEKYKETYENPKENHFDKNKAKEAFDLVNQQRVEHGLNALAWDDSIYDFACQRATHIVNNFSHYMPDGTYATDYLVYNIGGSNGFGENIAENYKSTTNLINAWMNSSGHRGAILNSVWNYGVMACYYCNGSYYWVNLFKI